MEGNLKKQSSGVVHHWSERLFLLLDNPSGLLYFESTNHNRPYNDPRGFVDFTTVSEIKRSDTVIQLVTPTRVWILSAQTAEECTKWFNSMQTTLYQCQHEENEIRWDSSFDL